MECNQCGAVVAHDPGSVMQCLTDRRHGRSWVMRVGGRNLGVVSTHRPDIDTWDGDTLERITKIADRTATQLH